MTISIEIQQHIGWLKMYAESMTENNWRDNRDRIWHQLDSLSRLIANGENANPFCGLPERFHPK